MTISSTFERTPGSVLNRAIIHKKHEKTLNSELILLFLRPHNLKIVNTIIMIIESSTIQYSITTKVVQNILHNNKDNFIAVIKIVRTKHWKTHLQIRVFFIFWTTAPHKLSKPKQLIILYNTCIRSNAVQQGRSVYFARERYTHLLC